MQVCLNIDFCPLCSLMFRLAGMRDIFLSWRGPSHFRCRMKFGISVRTNQKFLGMFFWFLRGQNCPQVNAMSYVFRVFGFCPCGWYGSDYHQFPWTLLTLLPFRFQKAFISHQVQLANLSFFFFFLILLMCVLFLAFSGAQICVENVSLQEILACQFFLFQPFTFQMRKNRPGRERQGVEIMCVCVCVYICIHTHTHESEKVKFSVSHSVLSDTL